MRIPALTSMLTALIISGCAIAQPAKPDEDHSAHHPPGGAPATAAAQPAPAGAPSTQAYERQMKAMQEMHGKMQAAKTPAERAALMKEHMKLMQAGMSMMGTMGGMGGPGNQSPQPGMGMMPSPSTPAGPTAAPGASGPGMQGMAGMMNMHTQMERRMAMMEQMMQMMVDREAAMPGK